MKNYLGLELKMQLPYDKHAPVSGKILIIDDEPALRKTMTRILQQGGFQVNTAPDGLEALKAIQQQVYDLVYLDIRLPGMSGLEILERIRSDQPELPVILFTAHATLKSAVQALKLGATDYLLKPLDPEVVVARTRVIVGERAIVRRRSEIQEQITVLQAELTALEQPKDQLQTPGFPEGERFLKRGPLILDLKAMRGTFGAEVLNLPPTAFEYLVVLAKHSPEVVDYEALVQAVQGYPTTRFEAQEIVKWHIHVLRQSIEPNPSQPVRVLNVRGVGYRLLLD